MWYKNGQLPRIWRQQAKSVTESLPGEMTNIQAEPLMVFISIFNRLASDFRRNPLNYTYSITPDIIENMIRLAGVIGKDYIESAAIIDDADSDILEDQSVSQNNNMTALSLQNTMEYLEEVIEILEDGRDVDEDSIVDLSYQVYECIYAISNYLQRAGGRYDQFVSNLPSPDEIYTVHSGDYDLLPDDFPEELVPVFASPGLPMDSPEMDVTDVLVESAQQYINGVSKTIEMPMDMSATKHNLSLRQLVRSYDILYKKVMSVGGAWVIDFALGLSNEQISALVQEGLAKRSGSKVTLTRRGYEKPQWFNYQT